MTNHIEIEGKTYIVGQPYVGLFSIDGGVDNVETRLAFAYWATRDGRRFGPSRVTTGKGSGVGRKVFDAAVEAYQVDVTQLT